MKLFIKIFLWFLAAVALMVGVVVFVTRTFQTDPANSRFQRSTRNQMIVYASTATQIVSGEGEDGLRTFLARLRDQEPPREVDLVAEDGGIWFGNHADLSDSSEIIARTRLSGSPEADFSHEERSLAAAPVTFPDGRKFVMVIQWERSAPPSLFLSSGLGYMRLGGILFTAVLLCYLLALYLTSPIRKLRKATHQLARGDLAARVDPSVGRRRDELADLARDFDEMAERIEMLITTQRRLNTDISHELRSPLARLNVALEIAKQRANPESMPILNRIEGESERLNEMIGRLLVLAKLESGAAEVERVRVDLSELVRDVAADAQFEAEAKGKYVDVTNIEPCAVLGSENLLRSAIENVLRNAVRYTAEGTSVDVSLVSRNGNAILQISDHGGGVPDAELANLFRPFYRVGEARERQTGGMGLGLAIADRAVKAHKGTITARNVNGGLQIEIGLHTSKEIQD